MTAKTYIIALLFIGTLYGQEGDSTALKQLDRVKGMYYKYPKTQLAIVSRLDLGLILSTHIKPSQTLRIFNVNGKSLVLDFGGDTLRTYGELCFATPNSDRDSGYVVSKDNYTFLGTIEQEIKEPKKKVMKCGKVFINVYPNGENQPHQTLERANSSANMKTRIACVEASYAYEVEV